MGVGSEGREGGALDRSEPDTSGMPAQANVASNPTPEEVVADIELLSDLDILMDLEFLELLEMLEAENLSFADTVQEETHGDSTGRN